MKILKKISKWKFFPRHTFINFFFQLFHFSLVRSLSENAGCWRSVTEKSTQQLVDLLRYRFLVGSELFQRPTKNSKNSERLSGHTHRHNDNNNFTFSSNKPVQCYISLFLIAPVNLLSTWDNDVRWLVSSPFLIHFPRHGFSYPTPIRNDCCRKEIKKKDLQNVETNQSLSIPIYLHPLLLWISPVILFSPLYPLTTLIKIPLLWSFRLFFKINWSCPSVFTPVMSELGEVGDSGSMAMSLSSKTDTSRCWFIWIAKGNSWPKEKRKYLETVNKRKYLETVDKRKYLETVDRWGEIRWGKVMWGEVM